MATLSLRMKDSLKRRAQEIARRQGVSLNNYVNATVAAAVAQEATLAFFDDRLRGVDTQALHRRVTTFMGETQPGSEPSPEEIAEAIRGEG